MMDQNTNIPHKSFLLISPQLLIKLFGVKKPETILYKWFQKQSKNKPFSIDIKTFKNFFTGKSTPQKSTWNKIIQVFPAMEKSNFFKFLLHKDEELLMFKSEWEETIDAFKLGAGQYDIFPFFQFKLLKVIEIEKELHTKGKTLTKLEDVYTLFAENDFIRKFLSDKEYKKLYSPTMSKQKLEVIMAEVICKITLYCAAYIDAEYCYGFKDEKDINDETKLLGKVSILQGLFPLWEKEKLVHPVERLFRTWKKNSGKSYSKMQQSISVSTNGDIEHKNGSQKRKFLQWRKCEQVAKHAEIINIAKGIFPEAQWNEDQKENIIIIYHVSIFCSNFFKHLREINTRANSLFTSDQEVVKWVHAHYDVFFDEAYADVEKYYQSA